MATAERIERGYLGSLLRLTLLAPGLVEVILVGHQPEEHRPLTLIVPFGPGGGNDAGPGGWSGPPGWLRDTQYASC